MLSNTCIVLLRMTVEYDALLANDTWGLVCSPANDNVVFGNGSFVTSSNPTPAMGRSSQVQTRLDS